MNDLQTKRIGWFLTASFIAITFIPRVFDNIMFVDGMIYASIARNMALGKGSFWQPYFMQTVWPSYNNCAYFCDHPPIMFLLESFLFMLFPDESFVENLYSFLILLVLIAAIVQLWRKLFRQYPELVLFSWLPVLCWYSIRTVWWSVPNNLLDTTMTVFCLLSCLSQLYALDEKNIPKRLVYWVAGAVFLILAFLTKGPIGLYPLAFPAIYAVVYGRGMWVKSFKGGVVMTGAFILLLLGLFCYEPAGTFISRYFEGQVIQSLLQKRETLGDSWRSHFFLIQILKTDLLPHVLVVTGLYILAVVGRISPKPITVFKKILLLSLLVALSGILPILISKKQGASYMMPALPFAGIFFAAASVDIIRSIAVHYQLFTRYAMLLIIVMCWGMTAYTFKHSEQGYLTFSLDQVGRFVPPGKELGVSRKFYKDSYVPAYFQRYLELSPTTNWTNKEFILADSSTSEDIKHFAHHKLIWKDQSGLFSLYKFKK